MGSRPLLVYRLSILACLFSHQPAHASCGASYCLINTDWQALGQEIRPGWSARLQFEFLNQDQLRSGMDSISPGQVSEDHVEIRTINRNWLAGLDYGIDRNWGLRLSIPYVVRSHIHNQPGTALQESWQIQGLGDVRVQGRYQFPGNAPQSTAAAILFGLKLPIGEFDERNADGEVAERSLQPGSGTTDLLFGLHSSTALDRVPGSFFAGVSAQVPAKERDGFRPGSHFQADLGWARPLGLRTSLLLQANLSHKLHDRGILAEPENSGSTLVSLSPGISFSLGHAITAYGFLQLPLYQRVEGVQLTYDYALLIGLNGGF